MTTETPSAGDPHEAPLVSVVMSTYNRSNIVGYAIESVRWQSLTNWELWVIGDACTDDTAAVVASFADPRIHFYNLPENAGNQSGPNNEGVRRARGRYLAYLCHDDLWLPDHLATMVQALDSLGVDLVWPAALRLMPKGRLECMAWNVNKKRLYREDMVVPPSLWVFRRELAASVGPWRGFRECYGSPIQDWLFRASKSGARLYHVPVVTAIKVRGDPNSYAERHSEAHRTLFERLKREPGFREQIVTSLMLEYRLASRGVHSKGLHEDVMKLGRRVAEMVRGRDTIIPHTDFSPLGNRLLAAVGLNPIAVGYFVRFGRKGAKVENLRIKRGLPAVPGGTPRAEE